MIARSLGTLFAFLKVFSTIKKYKLSKYIWFSVGLALLILSVFFTVVFNISDTLVDIVTDYLCQRWEFCQDDDNFWTQFSGWLISGSLFLFSLLFFKNILFLLLSPLMSFLSEEYEYKKTGNKVTHSGGWFLELLKSFIRSLKLTIRNISIEFSIILLLFLLKIIFPFLAIVTVPLIFAVQAYFIGFGFLDISLERHLDYQNGLKFIKEHKAETLSIGIGFMLLSFTGIGILVAPAFATIVATDIAIKKSPKNTTTF